MNAKRLRLACALVVTTLIANASAAQATPAVAVSAFYTAYAKQRFTGLPTGGAWKRIEPHVSSALAKLVVAAQAEQARCVKAHPGDKPPWIEGDMFTSNFEGLTRFKLADSGITVGPRSTVTVNFTYSPGGEPFEWRDQVVVVKDGARWLIDDVLYRKHEGFGNGFGEGLRKSLTPGGC